MGTIRFVLMLYVLNFFNAKKILTISRKLGITMFLFELLAVCFPSCFPPYCDANYLWWFGITEVIIVNVLLLAIFCFGCVTCCCLKYYFNVDYLSVHCSLWIRITVKLLLSKWQNHITQTPYYKQLLKQKEF